MLESGFSLTRIFPCKGNPYSGIFCAVSIKVIIPGIILNYSIFLEIIILTYVIFLQITSVTKSYSVIKSDQKLLSCLQVTFST